MTGINQIGRLCRFGFPAMLFLVAVSLRADPVPMTVPEITVFSNPMALASIVLAVLLEAICISFLLCRCRRPRLFILWLLAMHLFTYPLFLGLLWLSYGMHPVSAVAIGEGVIVFVEGGLIYLICRFISSRKSPLPVPSIYKSLFASLIGNVCSAMVYPFLLKLFGVLGPDHLGTLSSGGLLH